MTGVEGFVFLEPGPGPFFFGFFSVKDIHLPFPVNWYPFLHSRFRSIISFHNITHRSCQKVLSRVSSFVSSSVTPPNITPMFLALHNAMVHPTRRAGAYAVDGRFRRSHLKVGRLEFSFVVILGSNGLGMYLLTDCMCDEFVGLTWETKCRRA